MSLQEKYQIKKISSKKTHWLLLNVHYAKRIPSISFAFGVFENEKLVGCLTIGKPASHSLCIGVCGKNNSQYVYELNRLCLLPSVKENNVLSSFVGVVLRYFNQTNKNLIIVSYADSKMNHHGFIYQATNWIYTGLTAKRKEWRQKNTNTHSKTVTAYSLEHRQISDNFTLIERSQKHRYIFFVGEKRFRKKARKELRYKIENYPKGNNSYYEIKTACD